MRATLVRLASDIWLHSMAFEKKPSQSISRLNRLNWLCDRYERAWREGSSPRIEDYLVRVGDAERAELIRELLSLEIHYRRQRGEQSAVDEYLTRFRQLVRAALVAEMVSDLSLRQSDPLAATVQQMSSSGIAPAGPSVCVRYLGDYELLEKVARGGMGVVYKARQISLNRIVAVKMILAGHLATPEDHHRFHVEAQAAALLDHPNIVPVFEVGEYVGQHYFSMGYIDGTSLSVRLTDGPLPPKEAAKLVATVAGAVEYAHRQGVIHRDIKPSNVLLDRRGQPHVTDFGLAKRVDCRRNLTASGHVLGTPNYMSPEQAAGQTRAIGPAADIYALGALLYSALTGRPPFRAATAKETMQQVIDRDPVSPRQLNQAVPRDLEAITLKCMEKSVPRRYASAQALADDLRRYLDGRPILSRLASASRAPIAPRRRHPAVAALTATVVASMLIGAVVWERFAIRERQLPPQNDEVILQIPEHAQHGLKQIINQEETLEARRDLGVVPSAKGNQDEARNHRNSYEQTVAVLAKRVADFAADPANRHQLASWLADLEERLEAQKQHEQALANWTKLAAELHAIAEYQKEWDWAVRLRPIDEQPQYGARRVESQLLAGPVADAARASLSCDTWRDGSRIGCTASHVFVPPPPAKRIFLRRCMPTRRWSSCGRRSRWGG
jgi:serine/threonine-protein kinase